jgi:hypothetical protein
MAKQKRVFDKEKSEYYGSGSRKPMSTRKGQVFKDKTKYSRKEKHKKDWE